MLLLLLVLNSEQKVNVLNVAVNMHNHSCCSFST